MNSTATAVAITSDQIDGPQGLRAKLHAAIAATLPEGYRVDYYAHTGGGCRAIEIQAPNDRELLLTNGDAWVPLDSEGDEVVMLSYYQGGRDADGFAVVTEEDGVLTLEIQEPAESIVEMTVDALRSWVAGDPFRDVG